MIHADTWSWTVVWMATFLVHSTLAIGGIWLLTRIGRPLRPSIRDVLWKAAIVAPVLTASLQLTAGIHPLAGRVDLPLLEASTVQAHQATTKTSVIEYREANLHAHITMVRDENPGATGSLTSAPPESDRWVSAPGPTPRWSTFVAPWWPMAAVFVWLFVASALLAHLAWRYRTLRRVLAPRRLVEDETVIREMLELRDRCGIRRNIAVSHLSTLRSPVAYGHREICLPTRMARSSGPSLRTVLGHELAHLERGDYYWLLAVSVLEEALFFQPLIRLARREMQQTAEFLCDDFAVMHGGRDAGTGLAHTLACIAAQARSPLPAGLDRLPAMGPGQGLLLARVERLLDDTRVPEARLSTPKRTSLAGGLALSLMLVAPAIVAASPPPAEVAPPAPPTPPDGAPHIEVIRDNGGEVTTVFISKDGTTTVHERKRSRAETRRAKRDERRRARERRRGESVELPPRVVVVDVENPPHPQGSSRPAPHVTPHVAPPAPPAPHVAPPAPPAPHVAPPAPPVPHVAPPAPVPPLSLPPMPEDLTDAEAMRRWEQQVHARTRAWEQKFEREVRRQVEREMEHHREHLEAGAERHRQAAERQREATERRREAQSRRRHADERRREAREREPSKDND